MTASSPAYLEFIEFLAHSNPEAIVRYRPSDEAQASGADLIAREKNSALNDAETAELNHYLELEHILRLAKARAKQLLPLAVQYKA